jgi:hypothetical protein
LRLSGVSQSSALAAAVPLEAFSGFSLDRESDPTFVFDVCFRGFILITGGMQLMDRELRSLRSQTSGVEEPRGKGKNQFLALYPRVPWPLYAFSIFHLLSSYV